MSEQQSSPPPPPPQHHHHDSQQQQNQHKGMDVMPDFGGSGGPNPSGHSHVGGRIGRYQIIKTLGEGSFGKVKLAYHMATHQRVALKIINRKTLSKSDMQGRVEREISYLRLLRHPHIIKLYDVIKSKDEIIMVIEFAGKELFDYIVQRGKMPEEEARRFFQQIISAVEYCHRHKIVHRDLKPENLLLDDDLNVKIADFGLSNIMTDGNFLKTSCGSPNYAAPEVISGKLYAGPEVDVWSCGVILYVMLCGRLPFDDEFIPVLFKKISGGIYSLPSYLSSGAKQLLERMLVVNPLNRITVQQIMEDPWFKVNIKSYLLPENSRDDELNGDKKLREKDIDEKLVGTLGRTMGYDKEQVYEALLKGKRDEDNEIIDAYQILKDNKAMGDNNNLKGDDIDNYLASVDEDNSNSADAAAHSKNNNHHRHHRHGDSQSSVPGTDSPATIDSPNERATTTGASINNSLITPNTTIAVLPSSLPEYHRANMMAYGPSQMKKLNPISTKKSKTRWHFGIRSRSYPLDVMGEIYRALKNLGAEWARPSDKDDDLWTIHVRWKCGLPNNNSDGGGDGEQQQEDANSDNVELMKMRIQLYQLEQNNYLVDFKFDGWQEIGTNEQKSKRPQEFDTFSAYPFLHLATRLIMELAVNSQAS